MRKTLDPWEKHLTHEKYIGSIRKSLTHEKDVRPMRKTFDPWERRLTHEKDVWPMRKRFDPLKKYFTLEKDIWPMKTMFNLTIFYTTNKLGYIHSHCCLANLVIQAHNQKMCLQMPGHCHDPLWESAINVLVQITMKNHLFAQPLHNNACLFVYIYLMNTHANIRLLQHYYRR